MRKGIAFRNALLMAIIITVGFSVMTLLVVVRGDNAVVKEKQLDAKNSIDWVCDFVEQHMVELEGLSPEDFGYDKLFRASMEILDEKPYTKAVVYDADLMLLTEPHYSPDEAPQLGEYPIMLLEYPEFVSAVRENETGSMMLTHTTPDKAAHHFYIYYRWAPKSNGPADRYLLVVGLTDQAVQNSAYSDLRKTAVETALIVAIVNIVVIVICAPAPKRREEAEE
ncbi:MAG: hypothetical protein LBB86_05985 [Oscillospiraceae bacterium]|jgi:hypothetical protein|nr:hypothetical protein [Oscillospiraceae bacterium]